MTKGALILALAVGVAGCRDKGDPSPVTQAESEAPTSATARGDALIARFALREAATPERDRPDWAPPQRIVVHGPDAWAEPLRAAAPGVQIVSAPTPDSAALLLAGADVYVGLCTPAILERGSTLKWIHLWSAGTDPCAGLLAASERATVMTHSPGLNAPEVAEHGLGFVFALARQLHTYRDEQVKGQWSHAPADPRAAATRGFWEIDGKHLLIVGLGSVGTELARRAHALGMHVRATRNSTREGPDFVEYVGLADEVATLAAWADVVVNCTPLTAETRGMFNAAFFAAMKPTAYFMNLGRGESVVTEDLVAALRSNHIAGAALDVTDPEPLPASHALWAMPNVILTPHVAVASDLVVERITSLAAANVRRYVRGERLLAVVDVR